MNRGHSARGASALFVILALACATAPAVARADFRDWLRSKNGNVERGNQKMAAGDAKAALAQYDKAARELPAEGGVHLDRGLALMQTGDVGGAREALHLATQPPASREVRADAYYNLGLGFYREGDALAGKGEHEEAQKLFRESADAFKQSLRLRPGNRDAAWNLELGARRIREQEEKQKEKEKEDQQDKKDEDKKDEEKKDEDTQDPQDQGDKDQEGKDGEQNQDPKQDQAKQDQQESEKQDQQKSQKQDQQKSQKQDSQKPPTKPEPQPGEPQPKPEQQAKPIPADVSHALDALQDSEENLERMKARMRAQQERRAPEKDW